MVPMGFASLDTTSPINIFAVAEQACPLTLAPQFLPYGMPRVDKAKCVRDDCTALCILLGSA